ncbi:MAG: hypothetical protein DWQ31_08325 [Planctomycetota bacterium]|nr:MAG: hypothetical protein DWQ31_08325 [Planctomycetota bacterium]REJ89210.1 MAG: hypothetical protein DWQ35_18475 [Planctomycetota bacterium]REK17699.1 MAG: hypothetical protein DWQ42_21890 [Planctomycetota bacterium]REK46752.1 MAG: hypothetical protein DWQ46_06000 [Planctomycetota bacterium]
MHRLVLIIAFQTSLVGCWRSDAPQIPAKAQADSGETKTATTPWPRRIFADHLPNAIQLHTKVISGGLPHGDAAFRELEELGVKTVISVDGARPDVTTAAKYGLRYVHLPHGYDGVPEERVKQLAKAVRRLDGPIYIHCHHGKHRSPAAASVATVSAGLLPKSKSLAVLELAGTSPHYRGLVESAQNATPLEEALLDEFEVEFRESVAVPPLAEAMVTIERTHDNLKAVMAADWRTPPNHPDIDPAHEALLLREHFTELLRTDHTADQQPAYQQLLIDSEVAARQLETTLRGWQSPAAETEPPALLSHLADRIDRNCRACHQRFRDVPLSEK